MEQHFILIYRKKKQFPFLIKGTWGRWSHKSSLKEDKKFQTSPVVVANMPDVKEHRLQHKAKFPKITQMIKKEGSVPSLSSQQ